MRSVLVALGLALVLLPTASALPIVPAASVGPRVVPEPWETTDFIGFDEFQGLLTALERKYPETVTVKQIGLSYGWKNHLTGAHDRLPLYAVEVTNKKSSIPYQDKEVLIFHVSIHGNEKGGREGALRVIEDLSAPYYYDDAIRALLDRFVVVFGFANSDGWAHELPEYRPNCVRYAGSVANPLGGCVDSQNFVRYNGRGADLNRDWPTIGFYNMQGMGNGVAYEHAFSEPETVAWAAYYLPFRGRVTTATDIHGMLLPADGGPGAARDPAACVPASVPALGGLCLNKGHFVLTMFDGTQASPSDHLFNLRLAEHVKERLNTMALARHPAWARLPNLGFAGGEFNDFGTVWDTLGYTDSGITGDFFVQFLGARGVGFELAYNHITFDNYYLPPFNAMSVDAVREIVRAFMEMAAAPVFADVQTNGLRTAYLADAEATVAIAPTPEAGPYLPPGASRRALRSHDSGELVVDPPVPQIRREEPATLADFFSDMARVVDGPFQPLTVADVSAGRLSGYDQLLVAGRAAKPLLSDEAALAAMKAFVEAGGNLVLTDSALALAKPVGAPVEARETLAYLGYIDSSRDHPLAAGVGPLARETYASILLGYFVAPSPRANRDTSPIWVFPADGVQAAGGDVAGTSGSRDQASLGWFPLGQGRIVFLGAALAPPTTEFDHPYGLASYAISPTGYQILYNALGFTVRDATEERGLLDEILSPAQVDPNAMPAPGALAVVGALAALAFARRRRAP
ncbi:MAG TPA: M14 family zinc carboxypeptidase [Candidatus Thermoplasmatota archaeon]|nr:M14 family zinc carboxypeptidase [Candidatus Thermoplasmatota archaeon]